MNPKPFHDFTIEMCECRGQTDLRGKVTSLYERDDEGWIRCANCGNIPPEIGSSVPANHYVELVVYHDLDDLITRRFKGILYPEDGDE